MVFSIATYFWRLHHMVGYSKILGKMNSVFLIMFIVALGIYFFV